jgi:hypothetical protein
MQDLLFADFQSFSALDSLIGAEFAAVNLIENNCERVFFNFELTAE